MIRFPTKRIKMVTEYGIQMFEAPRSALHVARSLYLRGDVAPLVLDFVSIFEPIWCDFVGCGVGRFFIWGARNESEPKKICLRK